MTDTPPRSHRAGHAASGGTTQPGAASSIRLAGRSRSFSQILSLIERIAPTDKTVLISGPTGAGKEVIAQHIHHLSRQAKAPFLDLNCGAIPEHLCEAELFGHVRGAFTGAQSDRAGYFEAVGDGTLFLDEIAELPRPLQAKLLRALETRQFRPVGANAQKPFFGRVIAATHKDLSALVSSGQFREDLLHRLAVFEVHVPPLAQRRDDVPALIEHFMASQKRPVQFTVDAMHTLMNYAWPGNARELRNLIDRLCVLSEHPLVTAEDLESFLKPEDRKSQQQDLARRLLQLDGKNKLAAAEQLLIDYALSQNQGNKTTAATLLGVSRKVIERRTNQRDDHITHAKNQTEKANSLVAAGNFALAAPLLEEAIEVLNGLNNPKAVALELFHAHRLLGLCYRGIYGWLNPAASDCHEKALVTGRDICDHADLAPIQFGLWVSRLMTLELNKARALAQEMILRARALDDPGMLLDEGRVALANTLFWLGECKEAQAVLGETAFHNIPNATRTGTQSFDLVGLALTFEGLSAFQNGDFAVALDCARQLQERAHRESDHAFNKAIILQGLAWLYCLFENWQAMAPAAIEMEAISRDNNFIFYQGLGQIFCAFCEGQDGNLEQAEHKMRDGHQNYMVKNGGKLFQSFQAIGRGDLLLRSGRFEDALQLAEHHIAEAIAVSERAYLCELLAIKGQALLGLGNTSGGEQELYSALTMAGALNSVPARIRIATLLAERLLADQQTAAAENLLKPILQMVEEYKEIALLARAFDLLREIEKA